MARVNGGFMITKSWLAGGACTANSPRLPALPATVVGALMGNSDGSTSVSPSRSTAPRAMLPSARSPYSAMRTRELSYTTVGCTADNMAAVKCAAEGTMSQAVSDSSIIWLCRASGDPPSTS